MKVTKFVHSCLLVETPKLNILIDPGNYTWQSHLLVPDKLPRLDYIVVTHEHADHYHLPALKALSSRFPHVPIITNNDLAKKLASEGFKNPITSGSEESIVVFEAPHEPLPLGLANVLNVGIHIDDQLTYPGDSYELEHTRQILALPLTAPFASFKQAMNAIVKLKPKVVLPLHDWEWHKAARESRYGFAKELLKPHGIEFIELENSVSVEI
jgi:L-ascorbate metabolism protein UlaG (beta-lactamase superfamily)